MTVSHQQRPSVPFARWGLLLLAGVSSYANAADSENVLSDDHHTLIGLGVAYVPRFEGADDYRVRPLPIIDIQRGRFFARSGDGIGLNILQGDRFRVGASVAWMQGYRASDVAPGIGKLDDAVGARVFASTNFGGFTATVSATQSVSGDDRGLIASASLAYPFHVSERLSIIPSASVNWADEEYMVSYYGVDAIRAERSGLPRYTPSSGIKDVSVRVITNYRFTEHWSIAGAVGISQLMDDAADSPFVERKKQPGMMIGLSYAF